MINFDDIDVSQKTKSLIGNEPKVTPVEFDRVKVSDKSLELSLDVKEAKRKRVEGLAREFGEGVTFGLLGELVAGVNAATTEVSYREAKDRYEVARDLFIEKNPELADSATLLNIAGSIPTSLVLLEHLQRQALALLRRVLLRVELLVLQLAILLKSALMEQLLVDYLGLHLED